MFLSKAEVRPPSDMCPILFSNGSRGQLSNPERLCASKGCLRSLRAPGHLMGAAGVERLG